MTTKLRPEQVSALGGPCPCQLSPVERGAETEPGGGSPAPQSVIVMDPTKPAYIGIELVDTEKRPVPHQVFEVTLPSGQLVRGTLDQNGKVRIEGIDPGQCTVTFPSMDRRDFV